MADTNNNTATPETAPAAPEVAADPRVEALARTERRLHQERKANASQIAEWKAKIAEYETGYIPKNRFKEDPLGALSDAGVSYDQITELLLNQPTDPATKALLAKVKQLEEKQGLVEKQAQEASQRQRQDAEKAMANEIKQLVHADAAYETIKAAGCEDQVLAYIIDTYDNTGELVDVPIACQHIENYLIEEGYKFSQLPKILQRLQPKTEQPVSTPPKQNEQSQLKTLTNAVNASAPTRLTEKQRIERAILAAKGQLK